jgi:hypothetical protein
MARLTVVGNPFERLLLADLDKIQSLREHTINPPGQERYISPVDEAALAAKLQEFGANDPAAAAAALLTATEDDVSLATITTTMDAADGISDPTPAEAQEVQDLISYRFVETGHFLLSFDRGIISKLLELEWVKVFTEEGDDPFEL